MPLLDNLKKSMQQSYSINIHCHNCGKTAEVKVKKGITVPEAVKENLITCSNCGCVATVGGEYSTKWIK